MHYYSFADGPARSSIVNFIWRLNVPNSNAVPWYFSLTRTLFTAISPIKSVVDVNVKSVALSPTQAVEYFIPRFPLPSERDSICQITGTREIESMEMDASSSFAHQLH